jgi:hypothetical protein
VCDLETSRIGAPYIYNVRLLRVKQITAKQTNELHAMDMQYSESSTVPTKGEGRKTVKITGAQLTGRGLGA